MYNVTNKYEELIKAPVRYVGISGAVRLSSGEITALSDSNIAEGSLRIISKLNQRGDFRPGGVYSSELSAGLKGVALRTNDLDGAVIQLSFNIYPDSAMKPEDAETVRLGTFYVDGSTIKRNGGVVSLKAADGLMLFDIPSEARSGTLYELVSGACLRCGVGLATTQADFEAFPNGTATVSVNTARIQTERDLLMFVALMTGSFARITREGMLEFVQLTCEKDGKGMIIPVREIAGNIRFKTEFSDDTSRIAKLFTLRKGTVISSTLVPEGTTSAKLAVLELDENPLLSDMSDDEVKTALNNQLVPLFECLNRAFDADFNGDPALEVGDYVRLRGGAIDTDRGYATGMITSQIWCYHRQHTIKCTLPSSLTAYSAESAAVMALADTEIQTVAVTDTPERVQPKSQIEKRVDELEARDSGVGMRSPIDKTSEIFNGYSGSNANTAGVAGKECYASARGIHNTATGVGSTAEGVNCTASGDFSHVEGHNCTASGQGSHVEGDGCATAAKARSSHVEGSGCIAEGQVSHVEGIVCKANGDFCHAEGQGCTATGNCSHVEGSGCEAIGNESHAGGVGSKSQNWCDFAHGNGVETKQSMYQGRVKTAFGSYNDYSDDKLIFMVGNGSDYNRRSNAFAVDANGNIYCNSVIQSGAAVAMLSDDTADIPTYTARSNNAVEFGGITYTFESGANGAITQVTTSNGKTMQANIPAGVSIATHNAVFMTLAIMTLR